MLKNLLTILQLWKGLTQMSSPDFCLDFCMAAEILHKIPVVYNMFRIRAQFVGLGGGYLRKWNWDLHLIGNGYQPDWLSGLRQGDGFTPPIIRAHARQRTKHGLRQNWFGPILNCFSNVPRSIKPSLVSIFSGHIFHRFNKLSQCSWKYNLCACSPISSWFYQAKNMKVILI